MCFVEGPLDAHQVTNRSETIVRILMLSTKPRGDVSICIYPDSDKVGVYPPGKLFPLSQAVDYWHGET